MTGSDKLRICTACGNVYSVNAGLEMITCCPVCKSSIKKKIDF